MKDPFTSDKDRFLILGSRCSVCSRLVCVGPVSEPRAQFLSSSCHRGWDSTDMIEGQVTRDPFPRTVCASTFPCHSDPGVPHGH